MVVLLFYMSLKDAKQVVFGRIMAICVQRTNGVG